MSMLEMEKRLAALEREIARLKDGPAVPSQSHPIHALEQIHGAFENDDSFQQAMRLGRRWRQGTRPRARNTKVKRA